MPARALYGLAVAAAVVTALPSAAATGSLADDGSSPAACELPGAGTDPFADRAGLLAQYEQLPHPCLEEIFSACAVASGQTLLDLGSAAVCSFGYEALLSQRFGGNFPALVAWWRSQREAAPQ
jgi:hypothetical protein